MIRAWLFDAVGTLIELREPVGATYAREAARQGLALSEWRLDDAFRRVLRAAPPCVFPGASRAESAALEKAWWRQRVRECFLAADSARRLPDFATGFEALWRVFSDPSAWRLRDGAAELLAALAAANLRRAVLSNFDQRLPALLDGLGLGPCFECIVLPADVGAAKPDPRIFAEACRRLALPAQEIVYIGDDAVRDLEGARAAGLAAIDAGRVASLSELAPALHSVQGSPGER